MPSPSRGSAHPRRQWFDSIWFELLGWCLLCSMAAIQILARITEAMGSFDDGIPLVSAELVGLGRVPQIDFRSVYTPLQYYLLSAGFRLFGKSILVERAFAGILFCLLLAAIARMFCVRFPALRHLVPLMTAAVAMAIGLSLSDTSSIPSTVALLAVVIYASGNGRWVLAGAGLLAATAALVRLNFGLYAACVGVIVIFAGELWTDEQRDLTARIRRLLLNLMWFGIPFLAGICGFYAVMFGSLGVEVFSGSVAAGVAAIGPLRYIRIPLWDSWVAVFPCLWLALRELYLTRRLSGNAILAAGCAGVMLAALAVTRPYPSVAPILTLLGIAVLLFVRSRLTDLGRVEFCFLLYFTCLTHYFLSRAGLNHLRPLYPALVILLLILPAQYAFTSRRGATLILTLVIIAVEGAAQLREPRPRLSNLIAAARGFRDVRPSYSDADRFAARDPKSPWITGIPEQADEDEVIDFIRARTSVHEPLFVGVRDHSQVFANDVRIYWLADRLPGSRFIQLDAGVASRADVQLQIISDLGRNRVTWAVIEDVLPNTPDFWFQRLVRPDSHLLDEFLNANFATVATFGRFAIENRVTPFDF